MLPPDPIREADTKAWLSKVDTDLRCARIDLEASPPVPGDSVFHCQQAVEKSLKAFLTWHDEPFGKTHNLASLAEQAARLDNALAPLVKVADSLTQYAWLHRYPNESPEPNVEEAVDALDRARRLHGEILARLPDSVRP